jgi:molecular chaperone DnaK (HSP70)
MNMASWHKVIGIDLGTTFSAVAAYNFDRQDVRIIPNKQNEPTTPSVVYVSNVGQVSVGRAAKEKVARYPRGLIMVLMGILGSV